MFAEAFQMIFLEVVIKPQTPIIIKLQTPIIIKPQTPICSVSAFIFTWPGSLQAPRSLQRRLFIHEPHTGRLLDLVNGD